MMRLRFILCFVLACSAPLAGAADAPAPHSAAIASAHPLATQAGLEILQAGGNAFDAAVAVSAALAVVEPTGSGLGGGGFYLLRRASDGFEVMLDARESAPAAASRDMYLDKAGNPIPGASTDGPLAAGIPGEPAAFEYLAQKYGRLPLARSLAPAIRLAREGFPLYARLQGGLRVKREALLRSKEATKTFLTAKKDVPALNTLIKQPDLARTLELMAKHGAAGFYRGPLAQQLVSGVRNAGGIWTLDDLEKYRVIERKPVVGNYHGAHIVSASLPSSGGIGLIDALNILAGYDLKAVDSAMRKHLIIAAMQRIHRDRAVLLGDADFVTVPVEELLHPYYAAGQRTSIRADKAMPSDYLPGVDTASGGMQTTHFSVLDRDGNAVGATISLNLWMGTGFMVPKTGVLLNNTMDDFSKKVGTPNSYGLVGADANAIAPNKRALSSMSPTFVETPAGMMIAGSPGGNYIIGMVLLATLNYLDGISAPDIVKYPRFHHQYLPDQVRYEPGALSDDEVKALEALGYKLEQAGMRWGNMQVISWDYRDGKVEAASDPRGVGEGLVY